MRGKPLIPSESRRIGPEGRRIGTESPPRGTVRAVLADHRYDLVVPPDAPVAVLVIHPHPAMGGDRFNPVVDSVHRAAITRGWASLRFDFSSSDLEIAAGEASMALDLLPRTPRTAVVGYSFGAAVAVHVDDQRLDAWALIAPPFGDRFPVTDLSVATDERPKLLLSPAHDQFCPPAAAAAATAQWVNAIVEPVASADHFLAGFTGDVAARALDWIAAGLG